LAGAAKAKAGRAATAGGTLAVARATGSTRPTAGAPPRT
jgi:hypothetical protein